jgi:parallel beta-helix repeat protein
VYAGGEGDSGNTLRGNTANDNARNGIYAFGATENTFEANKMFGNAILDARDDARDRNIWNANQCVTDFPCPHTPHAAQSKASRSNTGSLLRRVEAPNSLGAGATRPPQEILLG